MPVQRLTYFSEFLGQQKYIFITFSIHTLLKEEIKYFYIKVIFNVILVAHLVLSQTRKCFILKYSTSHI